MKDARDFSPDEMMAAAAARELLDGTVCFVGIGAPSEAANLARLTHAPNIVLIYESGTIGAKPPTLPLSIGDGILARTADMVVSVPEIFSYWLQAGRIDIGFLSAAQIDRFGNLNTTVIGSYTTPRVRLPGAGGAPEIATGAKEVIVLLHQSPRAFVSTLDFVTSVGFGPQGEGRARRPGPGLRTVITDLGILKPDPRTHEPTLTHTHPGVEVTDATDATGWPLRVASEVRTTPSPNIQELTILRSLRAAQNSTPSSLAATAQS